MVHTHMRFSCNAYPFTPSPPYFCGYFYLLGPLPPQMVHLLPVPNIEWAMYELCVVLALDTLKMARVR